MAVQNRDMVALVVGSTVASVLNLAFVAFAGRALGPIEFADFSAGLALLYLVGGALSPIVPSVSHFAALHLERGDPSMIAALRWGLWKWTAIASAVLAPFAVAATFLLTDALRFRSPATMALALTAVFVYVFVTIDRAVLQGSFRFRGYAVAATAEAALRVAGIGLLFAWPFARTAMGWYVGSLGAALLLSAWQLRHFRRSNVRVEWPEVLAFAAPNFLLMLNLAVQQNADVLAVKLWMPASDAGNYGAAAVLVRAVGIVAVPLAAIAVPVLTVLRERKQPIGAALLRTFGTFVLLAAAGVTIAVMFADDVLRLLYGAEFAGAAPVLRRLVGVAMLSWLAYLMAQSLVALHRFRFLWLYSAITGVQLAGFALLHRDVTQIIAVQLVCQAVLVVILTIAAVRAAQARAV